MKLEPRTPAIAQGKAVKRRGLQRMTHLGVTGHIFRGLEF